jgi:cobalt/nickel transport system permease protein
MHISEGILTGPSFYITTAAGAVALAFGAASMKKFVKEQPSRKPLLGMAGAFIFLVSLVPIPAYMGTCSHPCGTPLAGILLGPGIGIALSALALFLQALLFAHGGFGSLGANVLSLGVTGAVSGYVIFNAGRKLGMPLWAAAGLAGLLGDVLVYLVSGLVLGSHLAFVAPQPQYSFGQYLRVIYLAYLPVQGPIALGEMVVTGLAIHSIGRQRPEVLEALGVIPAKARKVAALLLIGFSLSLLAPAALRAEAPASQPAASAPAAAPAPEHKGFTGMDEAVNEAMANRAGANAHDPYIDLEKQGDVWNFVLLMGGGIAGFIVGVNWHHLFGKPAPGQVDKA